MNIPYLNLSIGLNLAYSKVFHVLWRSLVCVAEGFKVVHFTTVTKVLQILHVRR